MNRLMVFLACRWRAVLRDRRGVSAVLFGLLATALFGVGGMAVDVGLVYAGKAALQNNTNAAALDGAYVWSQPGGTVTAAQASAQAWHVAHPVAGVSVASSVATPVCVTSTTGLSGCAPNTSAPSNAIRVTQTGSVPTYMLRVLGIDSFTVTTTAAASRTGGSSPALNIMFVLDATGSMNTTDANCPNPNASGGWNSSAYLTKFQCAELGIQQILQQLIPSQDKVGLMIFPGLGSVYTPCTSSQQSVRYGSSPIYYEVNSDFQQLNSAVSGTAYFDGAYSTSSVLNAQAPIVKAVGASAGGGCLSARGGQGTFYAQAINEAEAALVNDGTSGAQNVIIFLSDGDASATSFASGSSYSTTNQCYQGVQAAQAAALAGTLVYSIAYDSSTTSGCSTDTAPYRNDPCRAMQDIASDSSKFFSTSSSGSNACQAANSYSSVASAFQQVGAAVAGLKPRLVMASP